MKKLLIICSLITSASFFSQFTVAVDLPAYYSDSDIYLYGFNGSKEILYSKAKTSNNKAIFKVDKKYIGMMRAFFQKNNSSVNMVSENKNIEFTLKLDDKNKISDAIFNDQTNQIFSKEVDLEKKKDLILPALIQIKDYYNPNDGFYKSLEGEIALLSQKGNTLANANHPFLSYYQQNQRFSNQENASQLKQEDYLEMAKYNIPKNDNKIFLSKILKIIKKNTKIVNEEILINEIKQEFKNRIIDDVDYKTTHIKEFINEKSVVVLDEVESWEEAIKISGSLLVDNMYVKTEYIDEMINLVKKYGSYIVIDDGIALPHAGISRNVLKLGVGVLVVKKPVLFSDKKSANIFISFASNENKSHLTILNDLFDLITKYDLKGELLQAKDKHEVIDYFIKTKV